MVTPSFRHLRPQVTLRTSLLAVASLAVFLAVAVTWQRTSVRPTPLSIDPLFADLFPKGQDELFRVFNQADIVFAGRVDKVARGLTNLSAPPIHNLRLTFGGVTPLRGDPPPDLTFDFSRRQPAAPAFGRAQVLVAAGRYRAGAPPSVVWVMAASPANLALVRRATSLPVGWSLAGDRPVSPWPNPVRLVEDSGASPGPRDLCSVSGRPALRAGKGIALRAEPVEPGRPGAAPDAEAFGRFRVTVTNAASRATVVPALLTDGKEVCWGESLIVLHAWRPCRVPTAAATGTLRPLRLGPGESVGTIVDLLTLQGVDWPDEGPVSSNARLYFEFGLGELSCRTAIHYDPFDPDFHGRLRRRRVRELEAAGGLPAPGGGQAVAELIEAVRGQSYDRVMRAVRDVEVARAVRAATPAVLENLRDDGRRVRPLAVVALARLDPESAAVIPALREVEAGEWVERRVHALAARFLPEVERGLIPGLVADLAVERDEDMRGEAARDLGLIGPKAHTAVPALVAMLADRSPHVRLQAADTLVRIGRQVGEAVPVLIEGLRDPDDEVRLFAARSLAAAGAPAKSAAEALDQVARADPYGSVRRAAAEALGTIARDAGRPSP
jgi:hypothetical protein